MTRRIDDTDLARRCAEVGLAGFVLKSHYVPTAERAAVVRKNVPGVDALGAITLNASVGGLNPVAVEIAGRQDARVVWLPTVDSANQRRSRAADPPGAKPPMWAALQDELRAQGMEPPAVEVVEAALERGVREVLVTHPEFTSHRLPVDVQRHLAGRGALLERCFTTPHTGKVSWQQLLDNIRAVGAAHSVLSSDLGQPFN